MTLDAEPVPHATPLVTGACRDDDELNQQIADTLSELIRHALTVSDTKALFMLEAPMTMKDLGLRMAATRPSSPRSPTRWGSTARPSGNPLRVTGGARTSCSPLKARSSGTGYTPSCRPGRPGAPRWIAASAGACSGLMRKLIRSRGGR